MGKATAALLAAVACAACSWSGPDDGRDRNPANRPGYYYGQNEPDTQHHVGQPHVATRSGAGVRGVATFELVNGADVVQVVIRDLGSDLVRVVTPPDSKVAPALDLTGSTVVAGLRDTGLGGPAVVTVQLDNDHPWNVRLAGGAADQSVDLTGGRGGNVDLAAGTSRAEVTLPAADGTQRVTIRGGASQVTVRLGGSAPVRVAATGGAGSVTVDGQTHAGVAGGSVWTPDDWAMASRRYDVEASSGVGTMTVEHE
jgi:hypothetical protein